jgi:hypothetical protein
MSRRTCQLPCPSFLSQYDLKLLKSRNGKLKSPTPMRLTTLRTARIASRISASVFFAACGTKRLKIVMDQSSESSRYLNIWATFNTTAPQFHKQRAVDGR